MDDFYQLLLFSFYLRKESAVCVIQALWVETASLVCMMTTEQGSGGASVRETPTCLPGRVLLACTCPPPEPCTCLEVGAPLFFILRSSPPLLNTQVLHSLHGLLNCSTSQAVSGTNSISLFDYSCFHPGFDLNRALGDLIKYNFTSNQWESRPYGHSPVSGLWIH